MHIKVTKRDEVQLGLEYMADEYPADGLYLVRGNLYHRYTVTAGAGVGACVLGIYNDAATLIEEGEPAAPASAPAAPSNGVSERALLMAMAISAKPELAVELLRGQ